MDRQSDIGPVAELKNSAAGFLASKEGRRMEIAMKFAGTPPKMGMVNQTQAIFLRLCGEFFGF